MLEGGPTAGAGPALPWPPRWRSHSRICSGDQVSRVESWPFCAVAPSLCTVDGSCFPCSEAAGSAFLGEGFVQVCSRHPSACLRHSGHSRRETLVKVLGRDDAPLGWASVSALEPSPQPPLGTSVLSPVNCLVVLVSAFPLPTGSSAALAAL